MLPLLRFLREGNNGQRGKAVRLFVRPRVLVGVAQKWSECQDAERCGRFRHFVQRLLANGLGFGAITPRRGNLVPDR